MAVSPISLIFNAVDNASGVVKQVTTSVTAISFAYNQINEAIQLVTIQGQQLYTKLIGQNVELQGQLLATQSSLAATNKVLSGGVEIADPTTAIKALEQPVRDAVARVRKGSLELVGVTSAQLIPLLQITAQNSANIGANLKESADLTLSFAAALGTLGIPLDQARQELDSIYTAQITSDSQLAKSIGLNNQMVNQWKAQGVLVKRLNERLSAFRAGNALAANTINGVGSNIMEVIDEITRVIGEPLLAPIVSQMDALYKFLVQNKSLIQSTFQGVVNFFLGIGGEIGKIINTLQPIIETLGKALFIQLSTNAGIAASTITILVNGLGGLIAIATPVLSLIANIVLAFSQLAASDLGAILIQAGLFVAVLTQFAPIITAIQLAFTAATANAVLFASAAGGATTAQAALAALSPVLASVATSFATAGGGAAGFAAALGAAIPSLSAFGAAAAAALAPLLPIIAIGGAIAVTLTFTKKEDLKQTNEDLEEFRQQNNLLSDESIKLASKLKALNDAERANGKLTEEQTKKRKAYQAVSQNLVKSLEGQIQALKAVQPANEEQRRTQEIQIKQLERQIELQRNLSGGTTLSARSLTELGNTYQQLEKKVADAQAQFDSGGGGNSERFKAAAKELVDFTNQQLELGQITRKQAEERLTKVRNDARVEFDIQLSAQQAITKARQGEVDKRVQAQDIEQQKIQTLLANGEISETESQRRITESKKQQLQIQLEATQAAIAQEEELRRTQVATAIAAFDKQITEIETKRTKAEAKGDKGGVRLANEEIKKLETQKASASASLKIDTDRQRELKNQAQKFSTELAKTDQEERRRQRQERLKDFDEQQQILDSRNARRLVSESEYAAQSLAIARNRANTELAIIQRQLAKVTDKEGKEALLAQEAQVQQKLAQATEQFEQQKAQIRIKAAEDAQKILDAELESGLISQAQFNAQSLALAKQKADAEIAEIQRQRARLPKGDREGLLALAAKEADTRKAIAIATEQFEQQKARDRLALIDAQQAELEARLASGNITQRQFNQESLKITQERLQAELDEVARQREKLKVNDAQKLGELAAQEAQIRKKQIEALAQFQQQQIDIIEQAQERATEILNQKESERLQQVLLLERDRTISKDEAEQQRIDITKDRIQEEINLEKDKLAQLDSLPPFSDPQREEQRQSQIRASRLRTTQLTTDLIDNEIRQQENLARIAESRINREIEAIRNRSTAQSQALEKEARLGDVITAALDNQVQLLEVRKSLISSAVDLYQSELNILSETAKTEEEKKQVAEAAAELRLKAVREQAKIEREILELNLQQKAATLEQEKLQLRIQQIQARASTKTAEAELRKVSAKPGASSEEIEAAKLQLEAAIATEQGLEQRGVILNQQSQLNQSQAIAQLAAADRKAISDERSARLSLAKARVSEQLGEQEQAALRRESLQALGVGSISDLRNSPIISTPQQIISRSLPPQQGFPITEFRDALSQIAPKAGTVNVAINNTFTGNNTQTSVEDVASKFRKEMYNLGLELTRN